MDNKLKELLYTAAYCSDSNKLRIAAEECGKQAESCSDKTAAEMWKYLKSINERLALLHEEGSGNSRQRQLASLTEQEREELAEVQNIIRENLFDYHFQPIVNTTDGSIYSYEALMRPKSSICPSPFHILKYAELAGQMDDIERATFMNILSIIEERKESFGGRLVFINSIPKTTLPEGDFKRISSLLEKHSDTVVVEMTEQAELGDMALYDIKEMYSHMNIRIAVDDYGTGYSNVHNILRYMPNYVKIDRSLLSGIEKDRKKRHFVREIIEFCHDNSIMSLAEGVETTEELRTVIRLGVDLVQGYYTARPSAEIMDVIPYDIRREIKQYRREREEGKDMQIYSADQSERIILDRLLADGYQCIIVGKNGNGDVTVSGLPGHEAKISIMTVKGFKGSIILENAVLSADNNAPCIDIGEECEVRLEFVGANQMKNGGIRVPESSRLICSGDGKLVICISGTTSYAIGNDLQHTHGELVFEQGVSVESRAVTCVCIGSGKGGKIRILRGRFTIDMTGTIGVGIGSFDTDTDLDLFACDIAIDLSMHQGVAIGSFKGSCNAYLHSASARIHVMGVDMVGIGTVEGKMGSVEISEANATFNVSADHCSAIAALEGETSFKISRAGMHIIAEGDKALAIGGFSGNTRVQQINSDCTIRLLSNTTDFRDYIQKENVEISGGRLKLITGDSEIIL